MALYLGILIFSFIVTSLVMVPFINLLYRLHLTHHSPIPPFLKGEALEFAKLNKSQSWKIGTPIGGGVLIIAMVTLLYVLLLLTFSRLGLEIKTVYSFKEEINIVIFTFVSFGLVGLYDDIIKIFNVKSDREFGDPSTRKNLLILCLSFMVALMMSANLHISIIYIPFLGVINFGIFYVPIATLIIASFSKGFDITDGMDGLAVGILLICMIAFWAISINWLDTVLSTFLALMIGSLIAFLYFNIYPARIWLGNAGSLAFGAVMAVIGLLLGKTVALLIIGSVIVVEFASQMLQLFSVMIFKRKLFSVTPIHYYLQSLGWQEPKVVIRLWLLSVFFAILGLWFATI